MNRKVLITIPGLRGNSTEAQFLDIEKKAKEYGISILRMDWPYWKVDMDRYSLTELIQAVKRQVSRLLNEHADIVLHGESLGGVAATYLAAQFKVNGLILVASPYQYMAGDDMEERKQEWKEKGYKEFVSKTTGETIKIPYSFVEDTEKYNALNVIDKVSCPVTFIVGKKDMKVPNGITRKLYDKASSQKNWFEIEEMEHTYRYQPDIMDKVDNVIVETANTYLC